MNNNSFFYLYLFIFIKFIYFCLIQQAFSMINGFSGLPTTQQPREPDRKAKYIMNQIEFNVLIENSLTIWFSNHFLNHIRIIFIVRRVYFVCVRRWSTACARSQYTCPLRKTTMMHGYQLEWVFVRAINSFAIQFYSFYHYWRLFRVCTAYASQSLCVVYASDWVWVCVCGVHHALSPIKQRVLTLMRRE